MGNTTPRLLIHMNWGLFIFSILLFCTGIINLYSAGGILREFGMVVTPFYKQQLIWGVSGLLVMLGALLFDYRHFKSLALPMYILAVVLLLLVLGVGEVAARLEALRAIGDTPRRLDLLPTKPLARSDD